MKLLFSQNFLNFLLAFVIPVLNAIDTSINHCQAIILAPNRELAQQIHRVNNFPRNFHIF